MKNYEELARELLDLRRMRDELEGMIAAVQGEIMLQMEQAGTEEVTTSTARISWKPVKSSRFDKTAYIRDHGEESYKSYCKTTESRRFTVSA